MLARSGEELLAICEKERISLSEYAIRFALSKCNLPFLSNNFSSTLTATISAINISWDPNLTISTTLHSKLTGLSATAGADILVTCSGVKFIFSNLFTCFPDFTPHQSVAYVKSDVVRFITNSLVLLIISCEYLSGLIAT